MENESLSLLRREGPIYKEISGTTLVGPIRLQEHNAITKIQEINTHKNISLDYKISTSMNTLI